MLKVLEEPLVRTRSDPGRDPTRAPAQDHRRCCFTVPFGPLPSAALEKILLGRGIAAPRARTLAAVSDGSAGRALELAEDAGLPFGGGPARRRDRGRRSSPGLAVAARRASGAASRPGTPPQAPRGESTFSKMEKLPCGNLRACARPCAPTPIPRLGHFIPPSGAPGSRRRRRTVSLQVLARPARASRSGSRAAGALAPS